MNSFTVSVVVPTFKRPNYLERCVRSISAQSRLPEEIIVVSRDSDVATNNKIIELQNELGAKIRILNPQVCKSGFLPPIAKGISVAREDIVVFLDDDAEAFPDWLHRMISHYDDDSIGGVGGRCINYFDFKLIEYEKVSKVATLSWYGRSVGNMYKDTIFIHPIPADFFMGGNMSYRRSLLNQVRPDPVLNSNVAFHWELDVAQQVKKLGVKLIFDPKAIVNHYSAPREIDGLRTINWDGVYYSNYNYSYLMMKHLSFQGKIAYLFYTFLVGSQLSSGVLHLLVKLLRGEGIDWRKDTLASLKGRFAGMMAYTRKS